MIPRSRSRYGPGKGGESTVLDEAYLGFRTSIEFGRATPANSGRLGGVPVSRLIHHSDPVVNYVSHASSKILRVTWGIESFFVTFYLSPVEISI